MSWMHDIRNKPTCFKGTHESVYRSYHILEFVMSELAEIDNAHVRLLIDVVDDLQQAPDAAPRPGHDADETGEGS